MKKTDLYMGYLADERLVQWVDEFKHDVDKVNDFYFLKSSELWD